MFKINITNEGQRASWAIHVVRTKHDLCGIVVKNALAESSQKKKTSGKSNKDHSVQKVREDYILQDVKVLDKLVKQG